MKIQKRTVEDEVVITLSDDEYARLQKVLRYAQGSAYVEEMRGRLSDMHVEELSQASGTPARLETQSVWEMFLFAGHRMRD